MASFGGQQIEHPELEKTLFHLLTERLKGRAESCNVIVLIAWPENW